MDRPPSVLLLWTDLCPHLGPDTGCSCLGVWKGPSLKFRLVHHHKMPALPVALELRVAEALAGLPRLPPCGARARGGVSRRDGEVIHTVEAPPAPSLWPNPYSESVSTKLMLLCPLTSGSPPDGACAQWLSAPETSLLCNPCSGSWRDSSVGKEVTAGTRFVCGRAHAQPPRGPGQQPQCLLCSHRSHPCVTFLGPGAWRRGAAGPSGPVQSWGGGGGQTSRPRGQTAVRSPRSQSPHPR